MATLEDLKGSFGTNPDRLVKIMNQLSRRRFKDTASLIRLHEDVLFMLAYPQGKTHLQLARKVMASFPDRIKYLEEAGADMSPFDDPVVSGVAGTPVTIMAGYKFAEWLAEMFSKYAGIDWQGYEEDAAVSNTLPRLLPLLEEEGLVEAHLSFREYIHAATPKRQRELAWLMKNFSGLDVDDRRKAELYDSLKIFIRFDCPFKFSRSGLRFASGKIYYHTGPLIRRSEVSIKDELGKPRLKIEKLPGREGINLLNLIRAASVVRYRELHGFIWCDTNSFFKVDIGRGVVVYLNEVMPQNRLPLRAYHSGFISKNGVPIGYVEGISFFDKMEIGFNLYYTFRDGETAWLFAQLLKIFHQHLGIGVFTIDPYQVGHDNEEGIESGAFWFYRKLGFSPVLADVVKIVEAEENKIAGRKQYRTPPKILRKIAKSHLIYNTNSGGDSWKDFKISNILLSVQDSMATRYGGNADKMRTSVSRILSAALNLYPDKMDKNEQEAFMNYALVLSLVPGVNKWTSAEKKLMSAMIRAKGRGSEAKYLRLMQGHEKLRGVLMTLGCSKKAHQMFR